MPMTPEERKTYEEVKRDIMAGIEEIRQAMPEAGAYLDEHIVFDDENGMFKYTGDDRIKITPIVK